jgi:hypothetical protein
MRLVIGSIFIGIWFICGGLHSWQALSKQYVIVTSPIRRTCTCCGAHYTDPTTVRCRRCQTVIHPFASCAQCGYCLLGISSDSCPECGSSASKVLITRTEWYIAHKKPPVSGEEPRTAALPHTDCNKRLSE